jgi:hypothetical protein
MAYIPPLWLFFGFRPHKNGIRWHFCLLHITKICNKMMTPTRFCNLRMAKAVQCAKKQRSANMRHTTSQDLSTLSLSAEQKKAVLDMIREKLRR